MHDELPPLCGEYDDVCPIVLCDDSGELACPPPHEPELEGVAVLGYN